MDPTFTDAIIVIMSIMSILIVLINSICIYVICSSQLLRRKTTSLLIFSILLLHMIQGLFVIPFYTAKKAKVYDLISKKIICDGFRFSYMVTFYGMCVNVLLISIDRFLAVHLLHRYKAVVTQKRMLCVVLGMWTYMIFLCLIPFIPTTKKTRSNARSICIYNQQKEWTIFMLITNTLLAYVIVTIAYGYIYWKFYTVTSKTRSSSDQPMTSKPQDTHLTKQLTKVTFLIVFTYGATWAPSIFYYLIVTLTPDIFSQEYYVSELESYITFFVKFTTFFDAIGAPIIYCYYHKDFLAEFKKCREKIFGRRKVTIVDLTNIKSSGPIST